MDRRRVIACTRGHSGICEQAVHKLHGRHRRRECRSESWALHKLGHKCSLVILQYGLPTSLVHHYAVTNLSRIRFELTESDRYRRVRQITVCSLVGLVDLVTSLLELNRQEEGCRRVNAFGFSTLGILAATLDIVHPEVKARFIWLAAQEV